MKNSKRNRLNAVIKAEKLAQRQPSQSKYAAKVRAQMVEQDNGN